MGQYASHSLLQVRPADSSIMPWPLASSKPSIHPNATKPAKKQQKHVRFTPDTRGGSINSSAKGSEKTRYSARSSKHTVPTPSSSRQPAPRTKKASVGPSLMMQDFASREAAADARREARRPKESRECRPSRGTSESRLSKASKRQSQTPDVYLTIPLDRKPYEGKPRERDELRGTKWLKHTFTVKLSNKDWPKS